MKEKQTKENYKDYMQLDIEKFCDAKERAEKAISNFDNLKAENKRILQLKNDILGEGREENQEEARKRELVQKILGQQKTISEQEKIIEELSKEKESQSKGAKDEE